MNCNIYVRNKNECAICQEGYYLSETSCIKHREILNCKVYDEKTKDKCVECKDGFFPF